jgi:hypothetical protein
MKKDVRKKSMKIQGNPVNKYLLNLLNTCKLVKSPPRLTPGAVPTKEASLMLHDLGLPSLRGTR